MSTYLLEIGTEELPAHFANSVISQFQTSFEFELEKASIEFDNIFCSSTPRRIMILINGIIDFGQDKVVIRKGPNASVAYPSGEPGQAAIGFAKSLGIDTQDLEIKDTDKGKFVFGRKIERGLSAKLIIASFVPKVLKTLQGQRFMKWGYGNFKFSRPIRWIVSLYNQDILNFSLEGIDSDLEISRISKGHRLIKNSLEISNPENYYKIMKEAGVLVDRKNRKNNILQLINKEANRLKLSPLLGEELLDELTDLVEFPTLILCSFESKYLCLPSEVLCTVMKSHQRYIPLLESNKNISKLEMTSENILNTQFFCISNGLKESNNFIKLGNEKVLKARFSDAKFFVEMDLKKNSKFRNQELKNISYLKGLGNVFDKVRRSEYISNEISTFINLDVIDQEKVLEATRYSKHDLCSDIVYEFPELQGLMGGKYLKNEGFCKDVSLAVAEHYLPRFFNDDIPSSIHGAIVSISDKLESIISLYVIGKRPSGSSDPFAIRRNLNGIIQIVWKFDFDFQFDLLIQNLLNHWKETIKSSNFKFEEVYSELIEFIRQRIINHLHETYNDKDLIKAIAESENIPFTKILNIADLKIRLDFCNEIRQKSNFDEIRKTISRVSKLSFKGDLDQLTLSSNGLIDIKLFEKDCEKNVYSLIKELEKLSLSNDINYQKIINLFEHNLVTIENLFDNNLGVLIMCENKYLKANRLNILGLLRNYSLLIADFTLFNS